jgi:exonuclease III
MIRLITWNVAGRSARLPEQAAALAQRAPEIVALQEVTRRTLPLWSHAFELMGLTHIRASAAGNGTARRTLVLVGARGRLEDAERPLALPRTESAVSALAHTSGGELEIHCVHVPNAANGWVKVQTLQAVRRGLEVPGRAPRALCGDLNIPRRELQDGTTISFARDSRGRLRPERGSEWDCAELAVVPGLSEVGYRDAYRTLHGYGSRSPSWTWRTIAGHDGGWRLDHIFVSAEVLPVACRYHHEWREQGLSDHSALEADLELGDSDEVRDQ